MRDALGALTRALDYVLRPYARLVARLWSRSGIALLTLVVVVVFTRAYYRMPSRPRTLTPGDGWWSWYDQGKTLEALLNMRSGAFSPDHQWYPPLYALLGTAASYVMKTQPFFLPDLFGLVAFFVIFVAIARQLRLSGLLAAIVFIAVNLGEESVLGTWIEPWNTALGGPLVALGLLGALRYGLRPERRATPLIMTGAAFGLMLALRPSDILALLPTIPFVLWAASAAPQTAPIATMPSQLIRRVAKAGLYAAVGFLPAFVFTVLLHVVIWGFHASGYMTMSAEIGFDWRLIPLHWVTLVADPRPLFSAGTGLVEVYWWLVPGIAGMFATLLLMVLSEPRRVDRAAELTIMSAIVLHWCLYLAYRDLHPTGLWLFHNYHYFVWTLPFIALYAVRYLLLAIEALASFFGLRAQRVRPLLIAVVAGGAASLLSVCWRAEIGPWHTPAAKLGEQADARQVLLPDGLSRIRDILLLPADGGSNALYFGSHVMTSGGHTYHHFNDFRAFPVSGGAMVMPLRTLPASPSILTMADSTNLDTTLPPRMMRLNTVFGLPCWMPRHLRPAICRHDAPLPGPPMPANGHQIDFDGKMEAAYLVPGGWSDQSDGRWTLGYKSELQFRLDRLPPPSEGVVIEVEAAGFIPRGTGPLVVDVLVNDAKVAQWHVSSTDPVALRAVVPPELIPPDGNIRLAIDVDNARAPRDYTESADLRLLGLRVRALRVLPWAVRTQ